MRVYLAGAISKDPEYMKKFRQAEKYLRKKYGWEIVNPTDTMVFSTIREKSYKEYIDIGLKKLSECDAIYLLRDYIISEGARLEHNYARTVKLRMFYDTAEDEEIWRKI